MHESRSRPDSTSDDTAAGRASPSEALLRGKTVRHNDRDYVVQGFDPVGISPQCIYLADADTGTQLAVLRDQFDANSPSREPVGE